MERFTSLGLGRRQALGKLCLQEKERVAHSFLRFQRILKRFGLNYLNITQASNFHPYSFFVLSSGLSPTPRECQHLLMVLRVALVARLPPGGQTEEQPP